MIQLFKKESHVYKFMGSFNDTNLLVRSKKNLINEDFINTLIESDIVSTMFNEKKYEVSINKTIFYLNPAVGEELYSYYTDIQYDHFFHQGSYISLKIELDEIKLKLMLKDSDERISILKKERDKAIEKLHESEIGRKYSLLDDSLNLESLIFKNYLTEVLCWDISNLARYLYQPLEPSSDELDRIFRLEENFPDDFLMKWYDFLENIIRVKSILSFAKSNEDNNNSFLIRNEYRFLFTDLGLNAFIHFIKELEIWDNSTKQPRRKFKVYANAFFITYLDDRRVFKHGRTKSDFFEFLNKEYNANIKSKSKTSNPGKDHEDAVKEILEDYLKKRSIHA